MTVCRYFFQGTCRFGDKCRFEHTASNYDSYENQKTVGGYQERNSRQHGQSNNYHQYNQHGNDRYESNYNYNSKPRNYSSDSYSENYQYGNTTRPSEYRDNRYESNSYYEAQRGFSPNRYPDNRTGTHNYKEGYEAQRSYSPNRYSDNKTEPHNYRQSYEAQPYNEHSYGRNQPQYYTQGYEAQPRYNEHTHGRNQQYASNNNRNDNIQGQNKYQWVSNDYKKQNQKKSNSNNKYVDDSYATSTPKGKTSFSFKLPESEIKKKSSAEYRVNEQDQLHAELVKEDAKAWELGGLWPFTCYFPRTDKYAFPGFYDLSPEELRYAAYKAEENNAYDSYVQSVQNAAIQINQQRSELQIPTPQLLSTLRKIWGGENLIFTPNIITSIPFIQCAETGVDTMDAPTTVPPASSTAASFSFKMTNEAAPSSKSITSAFSFKLPSEAKSTVTAVSVGDADVYTPLENLTEEEKQQFSASTFVLGKIPTKPPPQVLCS